MDQNMNNEIEERKLNIIKLRVLEMETENIVKKESNPAMEKKLKDFIVTEVNKK
jgi:hypothetical protein